MTQCYISKINLLQLCLCWSLTAVLLAYVNGYSGNFISISCLQSTQPEPARQPYTLAPSGSIPTHHISSHWLRQGTWAQTPWGPLGPCPSCWPQQRSLAAAAGGQRNGIDIADSWTRRRKNTWFCRRAMLSPPPFSRSWSAPSNPHIPLLQSATQRLAVSCPPPLFLIPHQHHGGCPDSLSLQLYRQQVINTSLQLHPEPSDHCPIPFSFPR